MAINLKEQRFGIEIEFTGITRRMAAETIGEVLGRRVSGPERSCYHTRTIVDHKGRTWKLMRDSSVYPKRKAGDAALDEYKCEMVSPICTYEDIELIQTIVRALREKGACPASNAGIHVHIDGSNHTPQSLVQLLNIMVMRQDLINESLANLPRIQWCRPTNKDMVDEFKKNKKTLTKSDAETIWYSRKNDNYHGGVSHQHYNETRYHGLNLHAFFTKGTVEFRLFNSTLHAGKIKAYIQFCLAMSAWSINAQNDRVSFKDVAGYTAQQKVTLMHSILTNRLGLVGDEFKTCRTHMLANLKKNRDNALAA